MLPKESPDTPDSKRCHHSPPKRPVLGRRGQERVKSDRLPLCWKLAVVKLGIPESRFGPLWTDGRYFISPIRFKQLSRQSTHIVLSHWEPRMAIFHAYLPRLGSILSADTYARYPLNETGFSIAYQALGVDSSH